MTLKKIVAIFGLFISSVIFSALNVASMFTPEMVQQIKYGNTLIDLTEGLKAGKINKEALLAIAHDLQIQKIAAQEAKDLTLGSGSLSFISTGSALGFKIGTTTCDATLYAFGFGGTASVQTKNLLIAAVVALVLGIAYKKGYLKKIQDYLIQAPDQDEDQNKDEPVA